MPNWVMNEILIDGKTKDLKKIVSKAKKYEDGKYYLRSWFPMPKTFLKWDTTNSMLKRDSVEFNMRDENGNFVPCFNSDAEYNAYVKGFKNAITYQKKKYGSVGWYDYNCSTLGCKWDSEFETFKLNDYQNGSALLRLYVYTPNSAPLEWFESMVKKFHEDGMTWSMESHEEQDSFNVLFTYDEDGFKEEELPSQGLYDEWEEEEV